jgi:hypothetical protein
MVSSETVCPVIYLGLFYKSHEISGSNGGEYEDYSYLGYSAV